VRWTKNIHAGVWISAALFSALHFQFFGFLPRMLMGVVLGYLVVWSGSLIPSMIAHFANNALAVTVAYFTYNGMISEGVDEIGMMPEHLWLSLGSLGLFIAGMAWTARMSHWNTFKKDYFYGA
jgi:membrane protease YdiL (CAAX protease family)